MITAQTIKDYPALQSSGLSPRKPTAGPEYEIVLNYIQRQLPSSPKGQSRTIFLEPNIESAFPDIVAVYWYVDAAMRWSENRAKLTKVDIRMLHYMALVKQADDLQIKGSFSKSVSVSLERLHDADLVTYKSGSWRIKSLNSIFAVRRLITIEAKVSAWQKGLHQAFYNTWFASESYLLVPHIPKASRLLDEAERFGIGVVTHNQHLNKSAACARKERIPKSYASWFFNEWVWRAECFSYKKPSSTI